MATRTPTTVSIRLEDDSCSISPPLPYILRELTYTETQYSVGENSDGSQAANATGGLRPKKVKKHAYSLRTNAEGLNYVVTYQGLALRIFKKVLEQKDIPHFIDSRKTKVGKNIGKPRLDLMYGFRGSQEELITKLLSADSNGILEAPTRYGKTVLLMNACRAYPDEQILLTAPGIDLVQQLYQDVKEHLPDRNVVLIGAGSRRKEAGSDITVCSMDSLEKVQKTSFGLVIADEVHATVTDTRKVILDTFKGRRLGFGATPEGRADGRDLLIEGIWGPVLARKTYREAVAEGAICPIIVLMLRMPVDSKGYFSWHQAYDSILCNSRIMASVVAYINRYIIPQDHQAFTFIKNEKQCKLYQQVAEVEQSMAMAKLLNKQERKALTDDLKDNIIKRVLCSNIFIQGVTFHSMRALINASSGGHNSQIYQKIGRLAEKIEGKKYGIAIDFYFEPSKRSGQARTDHWQAPIRDSAARLRAYQEKGYEVEFCLNLEELHAKYQQYS